MKIRYSYERHASRRRTRPSAHAEVTRGTSRATGYLECLALDSEALDSDSSRAPSRDDGVDGTTRIVASRARARRKSARHVVAKPIDVRVVEVEPLSLETSRRRRL